MKVEKFVQNGQARHEMNKINNCGISSPVSTLQRADVKNTVDTDASETSIDCANASRAW